MKPIPLRKLKEETEVVEESPVKVAPSSWLAWGEAAPLYLNGEVIGFWNVSTEDDTPLYSDALPVEFFNHEIMDYDAYGEVEDNIKAAQRFVERYGVPWLPLNVVDPDYTAMFEEFYEEILTGTIKLPPEAGYIEAIRRGMIRDGFIPTEAFSRKFRRAMRNYVIPFNTVDYPITEMQLSFNTILWEIEESIRKPQEAGYYDTAFLTPGIAEAHINAWAHTHKYIHNGRIEGLFAGENPAALVSAICLQFIEAMDDPTPWRRCRKCGRLFKYQINERNRKAVKKVKGGRGHDDAVYCSKRCADAGRQYVYRHSRI